MTRIETMAMPAFYPPWGVGLGFGGPTVGRAVLWRFVVVDVVLVEFAVAIAEVDFVVGILTRILVAVWSL